MAQRLFRVDRGTLGQAERTPQGGYKIPAYLTRAGVFTYTDDAGNSIREWRPKAEVFRAESMAMLRGAPLALDHPPEPIHPDNFRTFTVGHVGDDVRADGDKLGATFYVQDAQALRAVEAGRRESSCGYHVDTDDTPGIVPAGEPDAGAPYDRVQRNIQYNHVAIVDNGRAGHGIRMRLDSAGNQQGEPTMPEPVQQPQTIKIEMIDGVEYTVGTDAHRAARTRDDDERKKLAASIKLLAKERDTATGRADAADAQLDKIVKGAKQALSPERMDKLAAARASLIDRARAVLGRDFKADGLGSRALRVAIINKVHGLRLDAADAKLSRDYIKGLWIGALAATQGQPRRDGQRADGLDRLRGASTPLPEHLRQPPPGARNDAAPGGGGGPRTMQQIRLDAMADEETRYQKPLAISRDRYQQQSNHHPLQSSTIETMR